MGRFFWERLPWGTGAHSSAYALSLNVPGTHRLSPNRLWTADGTAASARVQHTNASLPGDGATESELGKPECERIKILGGHDMTRVELSVEIAMKRNE